MPPVSTYLSGHEKVSISVMFLAKAFHGLLFWGGVVCFSVVAVRFSQVSWEEFSLEGSISWLIKGA